MNENNSRTESKKIDLKKYIFWFTYIVLLGISTPHMAYFFASFTDGSIPEWILSYLAAGLIEASIYISTYTAYQNARSGMSIGKFFANGALYLWIILCLSVSWLGNSSHAAHFKNAEMLSGTAGVPFSAYFIYIAGGWPILGLIFTFVPRVVTTQYREEQPKIAETRTPKQIIEDAEREKALLIAQAEIESTRAQIAGGKLRSGLKYGIGGAIGGTLDGIKESVQNNKPLYAITQEKEDIKPSNVPLIEESSIKQENTNQQEAKLVQREEEEKKEINVSFEEIVEENDEVHAQEIIEQKNEVIKLFTRQEMIDLTSKALEEEKTDENIAEILGLSSAAKAKYWILEVSREKLIQQEEARISREETIRRENEEKITREKLLKEEEEKKLAEAAELEEKKNLLQKEEEQESLGENFWSKVKIIDGAAFGYNSYRPYFVTSNGVRFASITSAYQDSDSPNAELYGSQFSHKKITKQSLKRLIDERKIDPRYIRYVKFNVRKDKVSIATVIVIHSSVRDHILSLLK